jgi:hypothetical protein
MSEPELALRRRITVCTWFLIAGLVVSGVTAIPLAAELDLLARLSGVAHLSSEQASSGWAQWILRVREGLHATDAKYPFMAYGTDWLAFGHIVIAVAFVGALRHPTRNLWLFQFGMMACALVVPWALLMGEVRGIPIFWRLIDCAFGVVGFVPCWIAFRAARELEQRRIVMLARQEAHGVQPALGQVKAR